MSITHMISKSIVELGTTILGYGTQIVGEARSSLPTAKTAGQAVTPLYDLFGRRVDAAHTFSSRSNRVEEIEPNYMHGDPIAITFLNLSNAGATDWYFDVETYQNFGIGLDFSAALGVGVKVYISYQNDGTAASSCFYNDVTTALFGATPVNADDFGAFDTGQAVKYVWIEMDNTGGAGTEDLYIYVGRSH